MGVLSAIGSLLSGDTIKDIGGVIDNLHTSGEEKAAAKQKMEEILAAAEQAAQAQVSARWEADMKHGSWLSKNINFLLYLKFPQYLSLHQFPSYISHFFNWEFFKFRSIR